MNKTLLIALMLLSMACDPTLVFTEPQPAGKKDLNRFPARFRGTYVESGDSSTFIVTADRILQKYEESLSKSEEEMLRDDQTELTGDRIVIKDLNQSYRVTRRDDSVFGTLIFYDTIFYIRGKDRLRRLGDDYFLNLPEDSLWVVLKLNFSRSGKACLSDIDLDRELETFRKHCRVEVQSDDQGKPVKYLISPSLKEFRTLLSLGSFTDTTTYFRISREY